MAIKINDLQTRRANKIHKKLIDEIFLTVFFLRLVNYFIFE